MNIWNTSSKLPSDFEKIEQAAIADSDAQPLIEADFRRMKRTPQVKIIRRALELTQEEFSCATRSRSERFETGSRAAQSPINQLGLT